MLKNLIQIETVPARSFLEQNPLYNTNIGGHAVLVAWFPEYETFGLFNTSLRYWKDIPKIVFYSRY
jgi:hypothetical protein